jgi:hypothetical protein
VVLSGTPASSTTKTGRHDIAEILLKVALSTKNQSINRSGRDVQHYVIKFVSDLRQVGGFLRVLRFPPPIKLSAQEERLFRKKLNNIMTVNIEA